MTKVFYASTLFGAMNLAAALDAGMFGGHDERRLLLTANNAAVPEVTPRFDTSASFSTLRARFDDVAHWNDIISPMHPAGWLPPDTEIPMLQRFLADRLGVGSDPISELVLESIAVAPGRTVGTLIPDCPVTIYADGLMSYAPTREPVDLHIGGRIRRLLHLDLIPGLSPLLVREWDVPDEPIPHQAFAGVVAELPAPQVSESTGRPLIVGQYLSALGLLSPAEEIDLYAGLLRGLVSRGHDRLVFAPHPSAGAGHVVPLQRLAGELGVELRTTDTELPVEAWMAAFRPELVVGCFSTALLTARRWFDLPVACAGTELMLERLQPYQNSNRVPVTLVDATVPHFAADGTTTDPATRDTDLLLRAVGYCMQPGRNPDLRAGAEEWLRQYGPDRYFKQRRLEAVTLAKAPPQTGGTQARRALRAAAARARSTRLTGAYAGIRAGLWEHRGRARRRGKKAEQ